MKARLAAVAATPSAWMPLLFLAAAFVFGVLITPDVARWWWRPVIGFACAAVGKCVLVVGNVAKGEAGAAREAGEKFVEEYAPRTVVDKTVRDGGGKDVTGGGLL